MENKFTYEKLNEDINVCVSSTHRFGTDAFLLADFAAPRHKDKVCDLGTGCGIIPMILCKRFAPKQIFAVDIQELAIKQCKESVSHSSTTTEVIPVLADIKTLPDDIFAPTSFDVVTCNPPYKANNSGILSELTADQIARHEVLCTIDDVCKAGARLLKFGGKFCICQRPERLCDVITAMKQNKIEPKRLQLVAKNKESAPWLFLIEGKKGAKPYLNILPTFIMYDGEDFSAELQNAYAGGAGGELPQEGER